MEFSKIISVTGKPGLFQVISQSKSSIIVESLTVNERNALSIIADNHWSENNPNPTAFWPRLSTYEIENNQKPSTWWLRDGDFLRLKSVEFGYTVPGKTAKVFARAKTRLYVTGLNLLNFAKFNLWDPEMAGNGLGYPPQRVINIGAQVNF